MIAGRLAQVACLLEASARKAGNVHRFRDFDDCNYLDFALSAQAIGRSLDLASWLGVGRAVQHAIEATRQVVDSNTNLGMVLLLAPLAAVPEGAPLRSGVATVLQGLTLRDAKLVYQAIRLANPGGLGTVDAHDVADEPTIGLIEAMTLAADRDLVARQYANGFAEVFEIAVPAIENAIREGRAVETAIVSAHLHLLAKVPDTLIARKCGQALASEGMKIAAEVLERGWPDDPEGIRAFEAFDDWLRFDGHARNPGATADLIAAALFAALRSGTIALPIKNWSSNRIRME
jgi:triphosphoribosyl-dephospho-CoA synthase